VLSFHEDGSVYFWPFPPINTFAVLAAIDPIESNIPTARAALLRALFGRKVSDD
jgi:hypothetical protein